VLHAVELRQELGEVRRQRVAGARFGGAAPTS